MTLKLYLGGIKLGEDPSKLLGAFRRFFLQWFLRQWIRGAEGQIALGMAIETARLNLIWSYEYSYKESICGILFF